MNRIKYKCKKCSWSASILEAWADIKPQFCGNKKCLHSFRKYPTDLLTIMPEKIVAPKKVRAETKQETRSRKYKKEETTGA